MPTAPNIPTTHFPCQYRIVTTAAVLRRLVSRLDDFDRIAPDLAILCGSGGHAGYALVTDGVDVVLVNAEGGSYPRYRSARIAMHLLPLIGSCEARRLCAPKECHDPDLLLATQDDLNRRCCR
jgi:DNA-binding transcriptional LysR family regulator